MSRSIYFLVLIAFLLRFGLGLFAYFALPQVGYGSKPEQAGYLFLDAYHRDLQARALARSDQPLLKAFDEKFSSDQYGGLLWLSAFVYRFVNGSSLMMVFLAALVGSLGGLFVYRAGKLIFDEKTAALACLLFLFYPDSILLGASQMREPFLMTLMAMAFYGIANAAQAVNLRHAGWLWIAAALAGMVLLSPGFVLVTLLALAGWVFLGGQGRTIPWQATAIAAGLFLVAMVALAASWESLVAVRSGGALGIVGDWARETAKWNADVLKRSSGIVQLLFETLPRGLAMPFVAVYGILQPVLPAALIEPGNPFWQGLGILRALGWYLLLPFVAYAPFSAWAIPNGQRQKQAAWLALLVWAWILIAALRGGGDQWDNPRYRVILLAFLAILAAQAFYALKTRWFWRILWVEGIILLVFTHWYAWRYLRIGVNLGIRNTLLIALGASIVLVAADLLWQARKRRNQL
ncbi:MAG: hypothetical protein Fur0016_21220 [Anaerolineales bacterium]